MPLKRLKTSRKKSQKKPNEAAPSQESQRINKILSQAGVVSRRKADEYIESGRVKVNGSIINELGSQAIWGVDTIEVDGKEISSPQKRIYLLLNKPFGYICSSNDPEGRPIVFDLLKKHDKQLFSVGRLDFDSSGLLLFTNDGEFAYRLTHPKYHVSKTYKVIINGIISSNELGSLRKGFNLDDGFIKPLKVTQLKSHAGKSTVRITVTQGRNRMVRRMFEALGYKVIQLLRSDFGNIKLGELKVGKFRYLDDNEVIALKKIIGIA